VSDLGTNLDRIGQDDDYKVGPMNIDDDTNEEIYNRKQAWAELEREQDEVKNNIKSMMRKAPESEQIDNPLLA
jgi:hypothetical protein